MAAMTSKSIGAVVRSALPFLVGLFMILIFRLPVRTGDVTMFLPYVGLAFVYYWVLNGPRFTPAWIIFVLGIFEDMVTMGPAGLNSLILISVAVGLSNQRRFFINRPFAVGWAGFAFVCFGALILRYFLESFYAADFLNPVPIISQAIVTVATYPIFGWVFGKTRNAVVKSY